MRLWREGCGVAVELGLEGADFLSELSVQGLRVLLLTLDLFQFRWCFFDGNSLPCDGHGEGRDEASEIVELRTSFS